MPTPSAPVSRLSPRTIGTSAAVITVLSWTSFILVARASADPARGGLLTPLDLAYCRIVGAALILLPWGAYLVRQDRARGLTGSSWLGLSPLSRRVTVSVGLFGGLLYAMLAYSGFAYAPALHASVLMPGSLPLWTALLAAWLLRDHITPARATGLALIVLGDLLVGGLSLLRAFEGGQVWLGDLLFMSAALCWATYSVLARHHGLDAVRATIAITTFAAVTYVPVYSALALTGVVQAQIFTAPLREVLFQASFQGWGSVVISGITFTQMIRYFGPVRSTMITALVPGLSAIGAVLILGEPLHWNLVAGLLLVTAGILFGVRATRLTATPGTVLPNLQTSTGR
ncbi:DMT family transporter [Rhodoferax sp.]|uniref:DMT family transporter n=1 Tax=Rhodoferax sp. TaxID=50421 RepID=UPI0027258811|nr:DMT family transporter [Rhodoferax sp.]MDO9144679.1 DMT family transporter [Rhodoferax sp.]MDP1530784.1 DMT family transporter [Rhodoferax sp.]MDP1945194.1 DMT family transporter [Rhodoferax sp.]MDP2442923.1 DMT family transporter [Rhodoferax sp.]MDP3191125.1 DMT family transporter [Rhodoferax sp.]